MLHCTTSILSSAPPIQTAHSLVKPFTAFNQKKSKESLPQTPSQPQQQT